MYSPYWARLSGAMLLAVGALSAALIAPPAATAADCPNIQVVFARGTNEPPGMGGNGQAFTDSLRALVAPRSVSDYGVDYPATDQFEASTAAGVTTTRDGLEWLTATCPGTRIVLGGYSQGVAVIEGASAAMPPEVADHVAAVVEFGSPRTDFAHSLWSNPLPALAPAYAGKAIDLCVPGDPICAPGGFFAFSHVAYALTGMTQQAAEFAASRL